MSCCSGDAAGSMVWRSHLQSSTSGSTGRSVLPPHASYSKLGNRLIVHRRTWPDKADGRRTGRPYSTYTGHFRQISAVPTDSVTTLPVKKDSQHLGLESNIEQDYTLGEEVGRGTHGTVFVATDKSGTKYGVKRLQKAFQEGGNMEPQWRKQVLHELDVYNRMRGSLNVAYLHSAYEDDKYVYLVTELCTGGELWERIREGEYSEAYAARIMLQVVQIVAQFHAHNIVWRDCKMDNLLFLSPDADSPLKAIDFGIAEFCQPHEYLIHRQGSPMYVAPEVLEKKYSHPADMWSAGVIAYMLLTGRLPWEGEFGISVEDIYGDDPVPFTRRNAFEALIASDVDFTSPGFAALSPEARDFLRRLLQKDPSCRMTATQALAHPWLATGPGAHVNNKPFESTLVQRLQLFGTHGRLKQAFLEAMVGNVAQLGREHALVAELAAQFRALGPDPATGAVPLHRVRDLLQGPRFHLQEGEAARMLGQLANRAPQQVHYHEWLTAMVSWAQVKEFQGWDSWVRKAFDSFDLHGSDCIDVHDLEALLARSRGEARAPPGAVAAALREADLDGSGYINFEEFKLLLNATTKPDFPLFASRVNA